MTADASERAAGLPRSPGEGQDRAVLRLDRADAALFGPDSLLAGTGDPRRAAPDPAAGAARLLRQLRAAGVRTAVVSASRDCAQLLAAAALDELIDVAIDRQALTAMGLTAPPDPAAYREAAARLGTEPGRSVIIDGTPAGVTAGRQGGFGMVIGVTRQASAAELSAAGAHLTIGALDGLRLAGRGRSPTAGT